MNESLRLAKISIKLVLNARNVPKFFEEVNIQNEKKIFIVRVVTANCSARLAMDMEER